MSAGTHAEAPGRRNSAWRWLAGSTEAGLVIAIAVSLAVIFALDRQHAFFQPSNLQRVLHETALFGVLAVGAAIVIIAGGIDLSVGSTVALSAVVVAKLMREWLPGASPDGSAVPNVVVIAAIGLTLLMGLAIGVAHALLINELRLPPFIATLATLAGLRSVAIIASNNQSISIRSGNFRFLGANMEASLLVFVIAGLMMGGTVLGRHLYALGGNEAAARLSGLRTKRLKIVAYAISGVLAALAGILFTGFTGNANPRMGNAYELQAITAAVVGGCSLSGGVGSIPGTVLGLILLKLVIKGTGIVVPKVDPSQIEGLVLGIVVVMAVAFNQRVRGRG
jgi:ribose/xylose/arabinose/galactoside ABC-type transport system permease subunit